MLFPEAVKDFDKAIDLNPSQDNAYNNRGICKFMQKKYKASIEDFNKAIKINPENAEAYNNRGASKILLKRRKEGCEDLQKAYALGDTKSLAAIQEYCAE